MLIRESDLKILRVFLERGANQFSWGNDETRDVRKEAFIVKLYSQIINQEGCFDYVHIHSIDNVGLVYSTLTLSCANWKFGKDAHFNLPPTPKGNVHFYEKGQVNV